MLPKISVYTKPFHETKYVFLINNIWNKVKNTIKKGFESGLVHNEKYLKTKIKNVKGKINTNFHDDGIPKEDSHWICLSIILIDSGFKIGKSYYPQLVFEECKYIIKDRKITNT